MFWLMILKHATFLLVACILLFSSYSSSHDVSAGRSPFSSARLGDPSEDWALHHRSISELQFRIKAPDGRFVYFDRQPIGISECKVRNPLTNQFDFPSPGLGSVSYFSDGKTLNTTLWLDHPYALSANISSLPYSFQNKANISQFAYSANVNLIGNKTLKHAVENHIRVTNQSLKEFHLYNNESGPSRIGNDPAFKVVYTFNGTGSNEPCLDCKETDLLTVRDHRLYILTFEGDAQKYVEFLPTMQSMINSTHLGFQTYKNLSLGIEIQYPNHWIKKVQENLSRVSFITPRENSSDMFLEHVRITTNPPMIHHNSSLPQVAKALIDYHRTTLSDFHLISSEPFRSGQILGQILVYNYSLPIVGSLKALEFAIIKNNKSYVIGYHAQLSRFNTYMPWVQQINKSARFIDKPEELTKNHELFANENSNFLTYENSTYRIRMLYPDSWSLPLEKNTLRDPFTIVVLFNGPGAIGVRPVVRLIIDNSPGEHLTLHNYLDKIKSSVEGLRNNREIESNANSTLAGNPAYTRVHTYKANNVIIKGKELGTIISGDKVMRLQYFSPIKSYESYLPTIQKMIDSLEINVPTLKYKVADFTVDYPYNWAKLRSNPSGYQINDTYGITFFTPVIGPYYYMKEYRLDIDYDNPYKVQREGLPLTVEFSGVNSVNPKWTKLIWEWALVGNIKKALYNVTQDRGYVEEGQGYVTMPIDMGSLNLPNQFYITASIHDTFLKDGQLCDLRDQSDLFASPPPQYSVLLSPTSLNNMHPDDEKNVGVQVKSNFTLPFDLALSSTEKDLKLIFNPNRTAGIPGGITTSNLHIKVLPNATVGKDHTFPVYANILFKPTFNPTNASVANITKVLDFTVSVLPSLTFQQQISEAWSGVGPALSGFVGLLTAIVGIGGIIGGFFLRKLKKEKDDAKRSN